MESEDDLQTVRLCSAKELGQMVDPFGDGSIDITVFNKNADSIKSNGLSARAYAKIIGKESSESYKLNEVPDGEAAFYIVRKYA